MTDEDIKEYLKGRRRISKTSIKKKYLDYMLHRFPDTQNCSEVAYRLFHDIEEAPKCPVCGGPVPFKDFSCGYQVHCSNRCGTLDPEVKARTEATNLERWGAKNVYASEIIKEKIKEIHIQNCGYKNPQQCPEIREKTIATCMKRYHKPYARNDEAVRETCMKRYHGPAPACSPEVMAKMKATCLKNNGFESGFQSPKYKAWYQEHKAEVKAKEFETKKERGNLKSSRQEELFYARLIKVYPDAERQYKCDRYPYACDFYVPSEDLFIELNYYWTHYIHRFNPKSEDDLRHLDHLKAKGHTNAVETWTQRDPQKFACAEQHSLNYLAFYSKEEGNAWLDSIGA